jgi:hypothetical protein
MIQNGVIFQVELLMVLAKELFKIEIFVTVKMVKMFE